MKPGETVGECIRFAREKRGLTQEDICRETRLSSSVVRAIEEDNFSELPAGIYTRNFVRTIAEFLELDFAELWANLQEGRKIEIPPGESGQDPTVWHEETVPEVKVRGWRPGVRFWLLLAGFIIIAGGLISWRLGYFDNLFEREPVPDTVAIVPTETGSPFGQTDSPANNEVIEEETAEETAATPPVNREDTAEAVRGTRSIATHQADTARTFAQNDLPIFLDGNEPFDRSLAGAEVTLVLEVVAIGVCNMQINVDDRRHLARHFEQQGGLWQIEGREFFIISAEGSENLKLRFNGEDYPLPTTGDGRLMAFRLDTRGARPGN
ncbi:MAG: helix-turn-helix domain-containing protein [bacterium]|nr:helix-turn-helix domain-containing protein [bacterium]